MAARRADVGGGVVRHLGQHRVGGGSRRAGRLVPSRLQWPVRQRGRPEQGHRRRRAQIGPGRHRRERRRIQDIGSRTRGPRPARGHIGHHRHRRGQHGADDVAHGAVQPARRVQPQHDNRGLLLLRLVQAAHDIGGGPGADGLIECNDDGIRGAARAGPNQSTVSTIAAQSSVSNHATASRSRPVIGVRLRRRA